MKTQSSGTADTDPVFTFAKYLLRTLRKSDEGGALSKQCPAFGCLLHRLEEQNQVLPECLTQGMRGSVWNLIVRTHLDLILCLFPNALACKPKPPIRTAGSAAADKPKGDRTDADKGDSTGLAGVLLVETMQAPVIPGPKTSPALSVLVDSLNSGNDQNLFFFLFVIAVRLQDKELLALLLTRDKEASLASKVIPIIFDKAKELVRRKNMEKETQRPTGPGEL